MCQPSFVQRPGLANLLLTCHVGRKTARGQGSKNDRQWLSDNPHTLLRRPMDAATVLSELRLRIAMGRRRIDINMPTRLAFQSGHTTFCLFFPLSLHLHRSNGRSL